MGTKEQGQWIVAVATVSLVAVGLGAGVDKARPASGATGRLSQGMADLVIEPAPVALVPVDRSRSPASSPAFRGTPDRLHQNAVVIEEQGFEDASFPPKGWKVFDDISGTEGSAIVHGWSRQVCRQPGVEGGDAAAWSVGGGSRGSSLPCGAGYNEPVLSDLTYGPIDATEHSEGLQVYFKFWLDQPADTAFLACVRPSPNEQGFCYNFPIPPATRAWLQPRNPLPFPQAAGKWNVEVFFRYTDENPDGTRAGVFIDNVVITGLSEGGTATPVPPGRIVHLPLVKSNVD